MIFEIFSQGEQFKNFQIEHVIYKLQQLIQIGLSSDEQGLWLQVFFKHLLGTLIYVFNTLCEETMAFLFRFNEVSDTTSNNT